MKCNTLYKKYVSSILSLGFVLEALAPNKISTVSYRSPIKDLNMAKFVATSPILNKVYELILDETVDKPRIGYWIRVTVSEVINNEYIRTNTCLGYAILTIPIIYAVKYSDTWLNPPELAKNATTLLYSTTSNEDAEEFYKALRMLNPSYANRYLGRIPDIQVGFIGNYTLIDILTESSFFDLIAYEVTHNYELTINTYQYMKEVLNEVQSNILESISRTQYHLISKYLDSEVVKGLGMERALLVKSYQKIINLLKDSKEVQQRLIKLLDTYLRSNNVNLGTLADILALATSFTLLEHSRSD
ncbi:MAG: triphosphoribosyl-dephospho-CoA synthase [Sulfolobales archaeon]